MRAATILFAGVAAATISLSAYAADQGATGMVTGINRLNGTIAIQRIQTGTVGANTGGAAEEFKIKDAAMMEDVHAGDRGLHAEPELLRERQLHLHDHRRRHRDGVCRRHVRQRRAGGGR